MAEFTKEQLIEKLERRLAVTTHYPDFEEAQLDAQIFKIALEALTAGMEQEPVAWLLSGGGAKNNVSFDSGNAYADPLREVTPLYTTPSAPVVQDERAAFNAWNNDENLPIAGVGAKNAAWLAWQARAVLCGNSVLKVPPERPADSSSCDDVEAWFDEGWNACRAAMLQSFGNSEQLNSPVIPDGWKLVPIDPTKDMLRAGQSVVGFWLNTVHCYSKMLAAAPAAPQQEADNG